MLSHPNRLLPLSLAALLVLGVFVPVRYLGWAAHLGWLATAVVAPISHPIAAFSRWIAPSQPLTHESEAVRELTRQKEHAESEVLRLRLEIQRLSVALEEARVFAGVNSTAVRQVFAPVFASTSDLAGSLLRARAGRREGVEENTVATASGMQLLGRVVSVDERTCDILPFNARHAGPIQGMVMLDAGINGLICHLEPVGDGTLRGPTEDRRDSGGNAVEPSVGQLVRLHDPGRWPQSAQMLILGKITAIEASPQGPLRKIITVTPTVERLDRVAEVVLRTSAREGATR
ncbi:MAG: hypothetical protein JNK25_00395 [Phycisphaerae bacterium]|nr:hypothetical protein [Phycisphaerae bacterium]